MIKKSIWHHNIFWSYFFHKKMVPQCIPEWNRAAIRVFSRLPSLRRLQATPPLQTSLGDLTYDVDFGPQMTTTQDGDGVLLTHMKDIFKLDCTNTTSCLWRKEPNNLKINRNWHLMFTVPSTLLENCNN